ncbi:MAG: OmpA family protein [Myxococcota bacterium]
MNANRLVVTLVFASSLALGQDTSAVYTRTNRAESSLALPTARLLDWGAWEVAVGYRHDGDVVRATVPSGALRGGALTQAVRWIDQRDLAWVQLAVAPLARVELDAALPVLLTQSVNPIDGLATPTTAPGPGDARFGMRFALLEPQAFGTRGFQWVLQGGVTAPTGAAAAAFGEPIARVDASTTVTWQTGLGSAVTAHAGYELGQPLLVGDQLLGARFVGGASYVHRLDALRLSVDVLSHVNTGATDAQLALQRATLELVAGARYVTRAFFADLGLGVAPVDSGITPRWFAQLALGARGFFFEPNKAAPTPIDGDGDGVLGEADRCPSQAEDVDGFEDGDGCPDFDDDRDAVPDVRDACPRAAEDVDGVQDADGCPERDADADGVDDEADRCPLAPEDFDGFEDADGCPEAGAVDGRTRFRSLSLESVTVSFAIGSATLDEAALAQTRTVARMLLETEGAVTLVGHADEQGPDSRNDALSLERAEAVKKVLLEAGVRAERLTTRGAGKREPLSPGDGFGRSLNRSVTFEWKK